MPTKKPAPKNGKPMGRAAHPRVIAADVAARKPPVRDASDGGLPIEVAASPAHRLGMPPGHFLRDYWQKRPLLVRGAFAGFESPVSPDELGGLACEPLAPSRLVIHDPAHDTWQVEHGPFEEDRFQSVPRTHWTLLVQDCDKLLAEVDEILERFDFVPSWRLDDVMISYATDGGSVGAHVDHYDVFLLQATGKRRWQIDDRRADAPRTFRPDVELKLLAAFEPTHDWVLEPGDMLYLPPGVPHHGVAIGQCTTWSVGMRAPSRAELLVDFAEFLAEKLDEGDRYADPDLAVPATPAHIGADALARAKQMLAGALALDDALVAEWFPRFVTRYRTAHDAAPVAKPLDLAKMMRKLQRGEALYRSPWSRVAIADGGDGAVRLVVAGESFAMSRIGAERVAGAKRYLASDLADLPDADRATLATLLNLGHLVIARA